MINLAPLIRVRKHTVEQKQKALAAMYKRAEDMKVERDKLETQLAIELEKTRDMEAELLTYFGPYSERVQNQIEFIDQKRKKLETQITLAQEHVRTAFAELKKIEIIKDRRDEEERAEIEKKESETLDEIAIEGHRRKT